MHRIRLTVLCILSFIICMNGLPVNANSAMTRWDGTSASGVVITDEENPIIVEKEVLTFDIQEFPETYYRTLEDYMNYSGSVTAQYTLYNPSDYTITSTLLFPFGSEPMYSYSYDHELDQHVRNSDTNKYDVFIDDTAIEKKIRYSFNVDLEFDLEEDLTQLHDDYKTDDFFYPDLLVTRYDYQLVDVDHATYQAASAGFDIPEGNHNRYIYFSHLSGWHTQKNGDIRVSSWCSDSEFVSVYAIGEPFTELPQWKFYKDGGVKDGQEIEGSAKLIKTSTMTFKELLLRNWDSQSGISEIDWYNAMMSEIEWESSSNNHGIIRFELADFNFNEYLMRWYEYTITLSPKERVINTVTAPLYPSINSDYEPPIYKYIYLLSPASTWTEFHDLDVYVNTPYHLIDANHDGSNHTDAGYQYHFDELPDSEFEFTLCSEDIPIDRRPLMNPSMMIVNVIKNFILISLAFIILKFIKKTLHK